jgi:hypothetical protein
MWTGPQIEAESPASSVGRSRGQDRFDEGRGKQEWGTRWRGKGVNQEGGEGRRIPSRRYKTILQSPASSLGEFKKKT